MFTYKTQGTCSRSISIEADGDVITAVRFEGGCRGNTQGVEKLCVGRTIDDVIALTEGIECRNGTSCPDQLSKALRALKAARVRG